MKALGLLEFKSIGKGVEATDQMIKSANVKLLLATPMCPGKYISIISGNIEAIKNAVETGKKVGDIFTVCDYVISNVHEGVYSALTATTNIEEVNSLGIIETMSSISAIMAGDIALKSANIELLEIRIARGLGGKGFVLIAGELSSVESSVKANESKLGPRGEIISSVVVASPTKELISQLY
ncbi:BMC domain-containing protein [Thermohalobacter berrensis]|uniref:Propanediol utilization protein n=1 Tax=Thermohalobacter berrensis TaxID=99594 RepID=A0A419T5Q7_9FIRM|nr:BMC domain-containing protein [Thermohalobacter berrensis]RKD32763.1 propanediol utilization protein [Thermohalobacter berrensis]